MNKTVSINSLKKMKQGGEKIAALTVYDASFTPILEQAGVDVLLVGDSLGMVIQGQQTTVPVSVNDIIYHSQAVARVCQHALLMADMPFMSFSEPESALANAVRIMQEGGAHMVKLEGGGHVIKTIEYLASRGIPVCGHLGVQPQTVYKQSGYRVQGRDQQQAEVMLTDARAMEDAGADIIVLECVPAELAKEITEALTIPTIGIGAGSDCDGQILVLYDILGISHGVRPKFTKNFLATLTGKQPISIEKAVRAYVESVKNQSFPAAEHTFS